MSAPKSESTADGLLLTALESAAAVEPLAPGEEVLRLFDRWGPSLHRYVGSFGLGSHDAEDIVQDVFLSLFRHVRLGRSRANLKGWLFRVAHNLALKRRTWTLKRQTEMDGHVVFATLQAQPFRPIGRSRRHPAAGCNGISLPSFLVDGSILVLKVS